MARSLALAPTERLGDELAALTREAVLVEPSGPTLRCTACAHRCLLPPGRAGACGVRFERDGAVRAPYGYVARAYVRPVETNTILHVLPGAKALTFGMFGCDLRCPYCHNANVSQALRDASAWGGEPPRATTPEAIVARAVAEGCEVLCAAYNEPAIAAEWVHDVFEAGKGAGLVTALITDGNATPELLAFMRPVTDVYRVDLKASRDADYHVLGGRLAPVLDAIRAAKALGYWVEVVTLVVPGFNDDEAGLRRTAMTIAEIDASIPWHLDAFQPRYRMSDRPAPSAASLVTAAGIGYARGLRFVYVGNDDAAVGLSSTRCPRCHETVVERRNWRAVRVEPALPLCHACGERLPGIWQRAGSAQRGSTR